MTRLHGKMGQLVITHSHSSERVLRGSAVFADAWLLGWLAEISADLRENGSALEVVLHDYALYKSTFTLLYFTLFVATMQVNGKTQNLTPYHAETPYAGVIKIGILGH